MKAKATRPTMPRDSKETKDGEPPLAEGETTETAAAVDGSELPTEVSEVATPAKGKRR